MEASSNSLAPVESKYSHPDELAPLRVRGRPAGVPLGAEDAASGEDDGASGAASGSGANGAADGVGAGDDAASDGAAADTAEVAVPPLHAPLTRAGAGGVEIMPGGRKAAKSPMAQRADDGSASSLVEAEARGGGYLGALSREREAEAANEFHHPMLNVPHAGAALGATSGMEDPFAASPEHRAAGGSPQHAGDIARTRALVVLNPQVDFFEGGAFTVLGADGIIPVINSLRAVEWDVVVVVGLQHPFNHCSFVTNHPGTMLHDLAPLSDGSPQAMAPRHCVQGTIGSRFHPEILVKATDQIIHTGVDPGEGGYSAFGAGVSTRVFTEQSSAFRRDSRADKRTRPRSAARQTAARRKKRRSAAGIPESKSPATSLASKWKSTASAAAKPELLKALELFAVDEVYFAGVALDYAVMFTVLDCRLLLPGVDVFVIEDACVAMAAGTGAEAMRRFRMEQVQVVSSTGPHMSALPSKINHSMASPASRMPLNRRAASGGSELDLTQGASAIVGFTDGERDMVQAILLALDKPRQGSMAQRDKDMGEDAFGDAAHGRVKPAAKPEAVHKAERLAAAERIMMAACARDVEQLDIALASAPKPLPLGLVIAFGMAPLHIAAALGHTPTVEHLLRAGALCALRSTWAQATPLLLAVQHGHIDVVQMLTKHSPGTLTMSDHRRYTPLMVACANADLAMVELLLGALRNHLSQHQYTAHIRLKSRFGSTAVMLACCATADVVGYGVPYSVVRLEERPGAREDEAVPTAVGEHGAIGDSLGLLGSVDRLFTDLHSSLGRLDRRHRGADAVLDATAIVTMLVTQVPESKRLALLRDQDHQGWCALHCAGASGMLSAIDWAILNDAALAKVPVNIRNTYGTSILQLAVWNGHAPSVAALLGAWPDRVNPWRDRIRLGVAMRMRDHTELDLAIMRGHLDCARLVVRAGGVARAKARRHADILLHEMILRGDGVSAELMLRDPRNGVAVNKHLLALTKALKYPNACTFTFSEYGTPMPQHMFECVRCGTQMCVVCRWRCHGHNEWEHNLNPDHQVHYIGLVEAYCACSKHTCRSLNVADPREQEGYRFDPKPVDTSAVNNLDLSPGAPLAELAAVLAEQAHESWAYQQMLDGWTYGVTKATAKKQSPFVTPFSLLPKDVKKASVTSSTEWLKTVFACGYRVVDMRDDFDDDDVMGGSSSGGDGVLASGGKSPGARAGRGKRSAAASAAGAAAAAGGTAPSSPGPHRDHDHAGDTDLLNSLMESPSMISLLQGNLVRHHSLMHQAKELLGRGPTSVQIVPGGANSNVLVTGPGTGALKVNTGSVASDGIVSGGSGSTLHSDSVHTVASGLKLPAGGGPDGMWRPHPVEATASALSPLEADVAEVLAQNAHNTWARSRIDDHKYKYAPKGKTAGGHSRTSHLLVPYRFLTEAEKAVWRRSAVNLVASVRWAGFVIQISPSHHGAPLVADRDRPQEEEEFRRMKVAARRLQPFKQGMLNAFLFSAVGTGAASLVPSLLSAGGFGAAINAEDEMGRTPLFIAVQRRHYAMAAALLRLHAVCTCPDVNGVTPLSVAAYHGDVDMCRLLLKHGASYYSRDELRCTPLHYACVGGHIEVVRLFARRLTLPGRPGPDILFEENPYESAQANIQSVVFSLIKLKVRSGEAAKPEQARAFDVAEEEEEESEGDEPYDERLDEGVGGGGGASGGGVSRTASGRTASGGFDGVGGGGRGGGLAGRRSASRHEHGDAPDPPTDTTVRTAQKRLTTIGSRYHFAGPGSESNSDVEGSDGGSAVAAGAAAGAMGRTGTADKLAAAVDARGRRGRRSSELGLAATDRYKMWTPQSVANLEDLKRKATAGQMAAKGASSGGGVGAVASAGSGGRGGRTRGGLPTPLASPMSPATTAKDWARANSNDLERGGSDVSDSKLDSASHILPRFGSAEFATLAPIALAAACNQVEIVEVLMSFGADPVRADSGDANPYERVLWRHITAAEALGALLRAGHGRNPVIGKGGQGFSAGEASASEVRNQPRFVRNGSRVAPASSADGGGQGAAGAGRRGSGIAGLDFVWQQQRHL